MTGPHPDILHRGTSEDLLAPLARCAGQRHTMELLCLLPLLEVNVELLRAVPYAGGEHPAALILPKRGGPLQPLPIVCRRDAEHYSYRAVRFGASPLQPRERPALATWKFRQAVLGGYWRVQLANLLADFLAQLL